MALMRPSSFTSAFCWQRSEARRRALSWRTRAASMLFTLPSQLTSPARPAGGGVRVGVRVGVAGGGCGGARESVKAPPGGTAQVAGVWGLSQTPAGLFTFSDMTADVVSAVAVPTP